MPIDRDGDGPPLRRDEPRAKPPADGLRASPFTEDVFDDEYYGRRPRRTGGISFGVITGVVFFAAIVAAAGWYILAERSAPRTVAGEGEFVRADQTPYKVKPDDPGGMQVANQDKLIYDDRLAKGPMAKRTENLLPAPEEPRAPPVKAPEPKAEPKPAAPEAKVEPKPEAKPEPKTESAEAKPAADPMADLMAKVEGMKKPEKTETLSAPAAPVAAAAPPAVAAAPAAQAPAASPSANPMLLVPAGESHAAASAPEKPAVVADAAPSMPVAQQPTSMAPTATPVAVAPATPGAVYVQLVSARSEEGALSEWKRISGKNADLLTGLSPSVAQAEVPDKGTFFRLRAGPIADRAAAQELCAGLIARGLTCLIVR